MKKKQTNKQTNKQIIDYYLSLQLEGAETLKYRCVCGPRSEKFNIVSDDHGRKLK